MLAVYSVSLLGSMYAILPENLKTNKGKKLEVSNCVIVSSGNVDLIDGAALLSKINGLKAIKTRSRTIVCLECI